MSRGKKLNKIKLFLMNSFIFYFRTPRIFSKSIIKDCSFSSKRTKSEYNVMGGGLEKKNSSWTDLVWTHYAGCSSQKYYRLYIQVAGKFLMRKLRQYPQRWLSAEMRTISFSSWPMVVLRDTDFNV